MVQTAEHLQAWGHEFNAPPRTHFLKTKCGGACLLSLHWGSRDGQIPEVHELAS